MGGPIHISYYSARPEDIDYIYKSLKNVINQDSVNHLPQTEDALFAALFSDKKFINGLLATEGGYPLGFCLFSFLKRKESFFKFHGIYVHGIFVENDYIGSIAGEKLVEEMEQIACQAGCKRIDENKISIFRKDKNNTVLKEKHHAMQAKL